MYHSGYEPAHYYVQLCESNFADENAAIILQISGEYRKRTLGFLRNFSKFFETLEEITQHSGIFLDNAAFANIMQYFALSLKVPGKVTIPVEKWHVMRVSRALQTKD